MPGTSLTGSSPELNVFFSQNLKGRENVEMKRKSKLQLQKAHHMRGGVYKIPMLTVHGLQNPWVGHNDNEVVPRAPTCS